MLHLRAVGATEHSWRVFPAAGVHFASSDINSIWSSNKVFISECYHLLMDQVCKVLLVYHLSSLVIQSHLLVCLFLINEFSLVDQRSIFIGTSESPSVNLGVSFVLVLVYQLMLIFSSWCYWSNCWVYFAVAGVPLASFAWTVIGSGSNEVLVLWMSLTSR